MTYSNKIVSVVMITYGHGAYISQAIEGVLAQETDFQIEVIIANDSSPDNTDDVVMWYINNHPKGNLLKYINHKVNIGMHANFFSALNVCQGKYVAFCEGDDYWTDPNKLKTQFDILENDADLGLVHSDYDIIFQSTGDIQTNVNINKKIPTGTIYLDLIKNNSIATLTVMVRKELCNKISPKLYTLSKDMLMIDYPFWLFIALECKVAYINKSMACYRFLENSASHSNDITKLIRFENSLYDIRFHFLKHIMNASPKIVREIITNHKYQKLAQLSRISSQWREFTKTFIVFHSKNRTLKHSIGSFYYLFKKVLR